MKIKCIKLMPIPIAIALATVLSFSCFAQDSVTDASVNDTTNAQNPVVDQGIKKSFFGGNSEGYWWYKKDPDPKKIKKQTQKPVIAKTEPKEEPKKEEEKPKVAQKTPPKVGSTAWIRENLKAYLELATDNPTVENLTAYLYMQRLAIDRAEQFAQAGKLAVQGDPLLDAYSIAPVGGGDTVGREAYLDAERKRILKDIYQKVGVFYVFKNRCFMCDEQARALKNGESMLGMTIKAISLDEPSQGSKSAEAFPDYQIDPNVIKKFKIVALPATFLYNAETDEIKPLMQGMVTLNEMSTRVINKAKQFNWIDQKQFNFVKPFIDPGSISDLFGTQSEFAKRVQKKGTVNPYGDNTNFIEPSELVEMIRTEKYKSLSNSEFPRGY